MLSERGCVLMPAHPCLQAQRCGQPGCTGWLLEQRRDNLHAGEAWACTACGVSVPSRAIDGASAPQDVADALRQKWRQALATVRVKVLQLCDRFVKITCICCPCVTVWGL